MLEGNRAATYSITLAVLLYVVQAYFTTPAAEKAKTQGKTSSPLKTQYQPPYLADDVNKVFAKVSKKISKVKLERLVTIKS